MPKSFIDQARPAFNGAVVNAGSRAKALRDKPGEITLDEVAIFQNALRDLYVQMAFLVAEVGKMPAASRAKALDDATEFSTVATALAWRTSLTTAVEAWDAWWTGALGSVSSLAASPSVTETGTVNLLVRSDALTTTQSDAVKGQATLAALITALEAGGA